MRIVYYLMSGQAHLPYLVVSLHTLRKHWDGPIVVETWKDSYDLVRQVCRDPRLDADACQRFPPYRGKNDQFLDKIRIAKEWPTKTDVVLYLDADTSVHGKLEPLFDLAEIHGFAATQFNDWVCNRGMPRTRILDLLNFPELWPDPIRVTADSSLPSVNGGVWAAKPESPVLPQWYDWTMTASTVNGGTFIADEKVLHVMQTVFVGDMTVACDSGRYNCSPKFQPAALNDKDVVIYHYHGDSCCRPQKTQRGVDLWWPLYQHCLQHNVGGIRDWRRQVKNKHLDALERELSSV